MKKRPNALSVTPKGAALLAAIEAGMLPKQEDKWALESFEAFWTGFGDRLRNQGPDRLEQCREALDKELDQFPEYRAKRQKQKVKMAAALTLAFFLGLCLAAALLPH